MGTTHFPPRGTQGYRIRTWFDNKNKDVGNPDISHVDSINKHVGKHETPDGLNVKGGNYEKRNMLPRNRPSTTT
jgi:hypothetical protein